MINPSPSPGPSRGHAESTPAPTLRRSLIAVGIALLIISATILAVDAIVRWKPNSDVSVANRVAAAPDLDVYLARREDSVAGVKPAPESHPDRNLGER